jgi:outer membrane lipoprotein-sorting protein
MNKIFKAIALVGCSSLLSLTFDCVFKSAIASSIDSSSPNSTEIENQANQKPDFKLFAQAIGNLFQKRLYQTESNMEIAFKNPSLTMTVNTQILTITRFPNQFRSEITFNKVTQTGKNKKYLIVSDGKQVWIYNPQLQQYSLTNLEKFQQANDGFLMGFSALFFLILSPEIEQVLDSENPSDEELQNVVRELNANLFSGEHTPDPQEFIGESRQLEGKEYYVYNYQENPNPKKYLISFWIDPITITLQRVHISGKEQEGNILIKETIKRRIENPMINNDTFRFYPSPQMKKVESIEIKPF